MPTLSVELDYLPPRRDLCNTMADEKTSGAIVPLTHPFDPFSLAVYPGDYLERAQNRNCFLSDESRVEVDWLEATTQGHGESRCARFCKRNANVRQSDKNEDYVVCGTIGVCPKDVVGARRITYHVSDIQTITVLV